MVEIILKIVGLLIIAIGVIAIYDARSLSKQFFSYSDKNTSVKILRMSGFLIAILGVALLYIK